MSSKIFQTMILILTAAFSIVLINSPLQRYELQITAGVFLSYFLIKKRVNPDLRHFFDALVSTFVVSNTINSTGGLASPFFFLYYFLLFSISLLLTPTVSLGLVSALIIFFLVALPAEKTLKDMINLMSLPLMTPFALMLGKEYQKLLQEKKIIKILTKDRENSLLFLSLIIKEHLKKIKDATENFVGKKDLGEINKVTRRMEKLIDNYERNS